MALSVADFFTQADALPFTALSELVGAGGALVVAPHPDDESLGCGGLLALCAQSERACHVVIVSDGAASHPNSQRFPHAALRDLRESEALDACAALGLSHRDVSFLRLPDSAVLSCGDAAEAAISDLVGQAQRIAASAIFVTWRRDPHCDHEASAILARNAAAGVGAPLFEYPVWGHTLPAETKFESPPRGFRLDVTSALPQKRAAIAAHRSQVTSMIDDDPEGFLLPPEMIARFERPFEIFLEAS